MSFLRSLRDTLMFGKATSRDPPTPLRQSQPAKVSSSGSNNNLERNSTAAPHFNPPRLRRSDTFTLESDDGVDKTREKTREKTAEKTAEKTLEKTAEKTRERTLEKTAEKKSKTSRMLSKFNTFTKRKKGVDSILPLLGNNEPAANTYRRWHAEAPDDGLDYDAPQSDPFNFLYERPSSLMELQNEATPLRGGGATNSASASVDPHACRRSAQDRNYSTESKERRTGSLTHPNSRSEQQEEEEATTDKYRTITLTNFRKSFRDHLRHRIEETPHNPPWFVEVEPPKKHEAPKAAEPRRELANEHRNACLVFENENYKPSSVSPLLNRQCSRQRRSNTRPTPSSDSRGEPPPPPRREPSIRVEIKNSITPNVPGRMVPVGVARPMPAAANHFSRRTRTSSPARPSAAAATKATKTPARNWWKPPPTVRAAEESNNAANVRTARYQTLVQIRNDSGATKPGPTCIQLKGSKDSPPTFTQRRSLSSSSRFQSPSLRSQQLPSMTSHTKQPSRIYFGADGEQVRASKSHAAACASRRYAATPAEAPADDAISHKLTTRSLFASPSRRSDQQQQQQRSVAAVAATPRRSRLTHRMPWK